MKFTTASVVAILAAVVSSAPEPGYYGQQYWRPVTVTKTVHTTHTVCPYTTPSHSNAPPKPKATHHVAVGSADGKTLAYSPPYVHAKKGDVVCFEFLARNHTVTQSDFDTPCTAQNDGFKTGFVPNLEGKAPGPNKEFIVGDDTKPVWFYCGQKMPKPHCGGGNSMVFAVNPPSYGNTFQKFQEKAKAFQPKP